MADLLTSWKQLGKQRQNFNQKAAEVRALRRQLGGKSDEYLLKRLSEEMGIDLVKILREIEGREESDRLSMREKLTMLKEEARNLAIHSRRRMDQAIKTYAKHGLIEGMHKLYPNQPNMRMKFANDWEGDYSPHGVPGIGSEYGLASISFTPELGEGGEPYPIPGHDGLCRRFHASCHACAGDHRFGEASASTTQTLIFRHDPPPAMGDETVSWTCGYSEVWVPMTITGTSYACKSDAVFIAQSLALMNGGGRAGIRLTIRVEQDTISSPLDFLIFDGTIWSDEQIGATWLLGFLFGGSSGILDDGPRPIDLSITEPYRVPVMLRPADSGGREVRVVVTLSCSASAENRHAEAEIDLASPGCGVDIHEVLLKCAGCVGNFIPE